MRVSIVASGGICLAQDSGGGEGQVEWMSAEEGEAMAKAFIAFEDKNDDKIVTQDEFGGPDSMFKAFDKDENGSIDITERRRSRKRRTPWAPWVAAKALVVVVAREELRRVVPLEQTDPPVRVEKSLFH
jgi:Ca2+-binding EF-hand superfamily protein